MNRQKLALCLLLLALAASLVYSVARSPKQQRVEKLTYTPGSQAPARRPASTAPAAPGARAAAPTAAAGGGTATVPAASPRPAGIPAPAPGAASAPSAGTGASAPGTTPARGAAATAPRTGGSAVNLALLERELPRFSGYKRNIFAPIFQEEVKLPPFKPLPLPPPKPAFVPPPPPAPPAPPPPPTEDQIAASELAKFTFLGFLKKDGAKTVFLSSNNEIFLAKKGSRLGPKYEVSDLTDDAITIKAVASGRELVIPLIENRALSTRRTSLR